jgi:hypothetical protein
VLKNTADETLFVDEIRVRPNVLSLSHGHEVDDLVPVIVQMDDGSSYGKQKCAYSVEPLKELTFGVNTFGAFKQMKGSERITIRLKWRLTTRRLFPFGEWVTVRPTVGDIRKLKGEDEEG